MGSAAEKPHHNVTSNQERTMASKKMPAKKSSKKAPAKKPSMKKPSKSKSGGKYDGMC